MENLWFAHNKNGFLSIVSWARHNRPVTREFELMIFHPWRAGLHLRDRGNSNCFLYFRVSFDSVEVSVQVDSKLIKKHRSKAVTIG